MTDWPPRDAFVDGAWRATQRRFAVRDPFDNSELAEVADSDDTLVDAAVDAALRAFPHWKRRVAAERGRMLTDMGARMLADERRLAELCTRENGKPLKESVAEVRYAASFLRWFGAEAERIYGETIPASHEGQRLTVIREPVGPCALITPWNFPYAMIARKLGAALAAGCTVVIKPAEQTPLSALALAQISVEVGVPPGVVNVVPAEDGARVGGRLVASPAIRKVSFTGSNEVGRLVMRAAADDIKRVSLELGGNAPFVVLADADVDGAVAGALVAKFRNTGQTCVAANRFIVEAPIAEAFTRALCAAVEKLRLGNGIDPGVDLGPLIDDAGARKVSRLASDAVARGGKLVLGRVPDGTSRLIAPMVVTGCTRDMALWREEIFGPLLAIAIARDEADAIAMANDTDAGLVAYVYTQNGARQVRVAEALEAGMVGINEGLLSTAQAPFGGIKHSGVGREGSRHGIDDYSQLKYIAVRVAT